MLNKQDIKLIELLLCKEEFRLLEQLDEMCDKGYNTSVVEDKQLKIADLLLKIRRLK